MIFSTSDDLRRKYRSTPKSDSRSKHFLELSRSRIHASTRSTWLSGSAEEPDLDSPSSSTHSNHKSMHRRSALADFQASITRCLDSGSIEATDSGIACPPSPSKSPSKNGITHLPSISC